MNKGMSVLKNASLMREWAYKENEALGLNPSVLTCGSRVEAYWQCHKCKGIYPAKIYNKSNGRGCPYCAGKKILIGFNDLETIEPELSKQWNVGKNHPLTPRDVTKGHSKMVWWQCEKGHEWENRIPDRLRGDGCPYCSNRRVLVGFNNLGTTHPELAKEWHPSKNGKLTPRDVTYGINKVQPWWICTKCGCEWPATILSRSKGSGCPDCGKDKQKKSRIKTMLRNGENSLAFARPDLATEWNFEKNGLKRPEDYTASSDEEVWWKCSECGNEWRVSINHRAKGRGCKKCREKSTSFAEQAIYYYIESYYNDAINRDVSMGFELDIYIPSMLTAIEYDGAYFHGDNKRGLEDSEKDRLCSDHGIQLIRIREKGLPKLESSICVIRADESYRSLENCITQLFEILGVSNSIVPNIREDISRINALYKVNRKDRSLASEYPDVAKRWHPTKNGALLPSQVSAKSGNGAWWICPEGHEYWQKIASATAGHGCQKCARKNVGLQLQKKGIVVGKNDLKTLYPVIALEWDYEKNEDVPEDYKPGSNIERHWICSKCDHRWPSRILNRTKLNRGCPECAKKNVRDSKIKPVKCIETGEVFSSIEDAAKWAGVTKSAISCCARGKTKISAGYHWKYVCKRENQVD